MDPCDSPYFNDKCSNYYYALYSYYKSQRDLQEKFSTPMLWIGIYIAAASLLCSLAMAADAFRGFRLRKLWFPCKFFSVNAASLTLLGVAMKLPMDLSMPMTGRMDQLAKLSRTVFMCTIMCNIMPSLGPMNNQELLMNVVALGILVITIVVNVCIQLNTHLIVYLAWEHAVIIFFMLVSLVILSFSALTVPISKKILELKYNEIHRIISNEESGQAGKFTVEKLKDCVKKYCMMAETGGPQFVMASSATCSVLGVICFLAALTLAKSMVVLMPRDIAILTDLDWYTDSDYKWSNFLILVIQSIGVGVGTIAPVFRWFTAISFKSSKKRSNWFQKQFQIENYWIQTLVEWKESPFALQIRGRKRRKLVQDTKNLVLNICIGVQMMIVVVSKAAQLIPIFFIRMTLSCCCYCKLLKRKIKPEPNASSNCIGKESESGTELDLNRYVLQLEDEEVLPKKILQNISDGVNRLIQMGKRQQPRNLMELLKKSTGFKGVAEFDTNQVPSIYSEESYYCWALPVVTLTSIAIAIPNIEKHMVDQLVHSVSEGLLYVSLIEKVLDTKGDLLTIRNAADVVWLGVDLYCKWLDKDLQKMALKGKSSVENLLWLSDIAKNHVMEFKRNLNGGPDENPLNWPVKIIAANSMYRISQTILLNYPGSKDKAEEKLFEQLSVMIADILGACLTNLPHVITLKCFCSAIENREESVRVAARLLGETEEIIKILQQLELPSLNPDQTALIDEWRALTRQKNPSAFIWSSDNETDSFGSDELHIAVDI